MITNTIQAVVWDFDGVIIDSEKLHIEAEIITLKSFGVTLTREIAEEYLGYTLNVYFGKLARRLKINVSTKVILQKHMETLHDYYRRIFPLTAFARETLEQIQKNYSMGLVTNRERDLVEVGMKRFSLRQYFKAMVCKEDVKRNKPDPEPYLTVAKKLEVPPEAVIAVEDSRTGIQSAKNAGMYVIARRAAHNQSQDFSFADCEVEDLRDVLKCVPH